MGLLKSKKFWIPMSIGVSSAAVITGITLSQTVFSDSFKLNQKANQIVASTIALHNFDETNKPLDLANTYAFNVKKSQITLNQSQLDIAGYQVDLALDLESNPASKLNQGILAITVIVKDLKTNLTTTRVVEIKGFKTVDQTLEKLLNNQQVLDLTQKEANTNNDFFTIEEINNGLIKPDLKATEECGLNKLLKASNTTTSNGKSCLIRGQVKLEKIVKENNKAVFYLTSEDLSNPLRILKTENNALTEAAIGQIKITNLLATSIDVVPIGYDKDQSKGLFDLLTKTNNQVSYNDNKGNRRLFLEVWPDISTNGNKLASSPLATGYLDPFVVENYGTKDAIEASLLVSYGMGNTAKNYSTLNQEDLSVLTNAGFKFGIYAKKFGDTKAAAAIKNADIVKETNELKDLFKTVPFNKPYTRKTADEVKKKQITFTDTSTSSNIPSQFSISKQISNGSSARSSRSGNNQTNTAPQNWLVGVDYRYDGITDSKYLFAGSISLIHLSK